MAPNVRQRHGGHTPTQMCPVWRGLGPFLGVSALFVVIAECRESASAAQGPWGCGAGECPCSNTMFWEHTELCALVFQEPCSVPALPGCSGVPFGGPLEVQVSHLQCAAVAGALGAELDTVSWEDEVVL